MRNAFIARIHSHSRHLIHYMRNLLYFGFLRKIVKFIDSPCHLSATSSRQPHTNKYVPLIWLTFSMFTLAIRYSTHDDMILCQQTNNPEFVEFVAVFNIYDSLSIVLANGISIMCECVFDKVTNTYIE